MKTLIVKGLFFFRYWFLIAFPVFILDFTTMPFFDAHTLEMLIALAMASLAFVITVGALPVVRVVEVLSVVRVVPHAPPRAGRK